MKKPQLITALVAILSVILIYSFARTSPEKKHLAQQAHSEHDGHDHGAPGRVLTTDSILTIAKTQLSAEQVSRITQLENSITRGDLKTQQKRVFEQLAGFWGDTMRIFAPYAWYRAEAARLENSEKTLTFAAQLFLENLQLEADPSIRTWEALQAKDLFERSLKINPANDSARIGIGACYLFGGISDQPMTGINMIREVADRDSTNVYAQLTLAKGSMYSGQIDRAIARLETVNRLQHSNVEAMLMLAEIYERKQDRKNAAAWYERSLNHIDREDIKGEIRKRILELGK